MAVSFFGLFANTSQAQQATATLTGVVTDQTGAVITNATVTATNQATNLSRTVTTNGEGVYVISSLPVGEYKVKFDAVGFANHNSYEKITLGVGQTVSLNTEIGAGGPESIVTITDNPIIDTQTSQVDEVINDKEIENLPLNGRNFLELALLTPGNAPAPNFDPTKTNTRNNRDALRLSPFADFNFSFRRSAGHSFARRFIQNSTIST